MTAGTAGRLVANGLFLFALAIWGGMVVFFTFVTTTTVFDTLNRDLAAILLGKLFPLYFQIQLLCAVVALAFVVERLLHLGDPPRRPVQVATVLLVLAVLISGYLAFVLQPQMAAAQVAVGSFEATPQNAPTRVLFGQLHGRAMILNAITALFGGAVLLITAAQPGVLLHIGEQRQPATTSQATPIHVGPAPREARKQPPTY